jgi:hypothetical protein
MIPGPTVRYYLNYTILVLVSLFGKAIVHFRVSWVRSHIYLKIVKIQY